MTGNEKGRAALVNENKNLKAEILKTKNHLKTLKETRRDTRDQGARGVMGRRKELVTPLAVQKTTGDDPGTNALV